MLKGEGETVFQFDLTQRKFSADLSENNVRKQI